MLDPYLIFNGYSNHLYNNEGKFERAQSIFFMEKYEQPIHLILHKSKYDNFGT